MMKKFNKFLFLLTSLIALPLAGCSTTPESNDTELKKLVTEVHLDQDFITLEVGESIELQPIISFKDTIAGMDVIVIQNGKHQYRSTILFLLLVKTKKLLQKN